METIQSSESGDSEYYIESEDDKNKLIEKEPSLPDESGWQVFSKYFRSLFGVPMLIVCGILFLITEVTNIFYARGIQLWNADMLGPNP